MAASNSSVGWQLPDLRHEANGSGDICDQLGRIPHPPAQPLPSGLAASVLVLRWLLLILTASNPCFWDHVEREGDDDVARKLRGQAKALDAKNCILQYVWRDLPKWPRGHENTREEKMVAEEQQRLLAAVRKMGLASLSFHNIMESTVMEKTFWAREPLVLARFTYIDSDGQARSVQPPGHPSLVKWSGEGILADRVQAKFGVIAGPGSEKMEARPAAPYIIRALFTPGEESTADFNNLEVMLVEVNMGGVEEVWTFSLVAMVRLRANAEEEDMVRLYPFTASLSTIPLPAGLPCVSAEWRVGEVGHSYALFYSRVAGPEPLRHYMGKPEVSAHWDGPLALQRMVDKAAKMPRAPTEEFIRWMATDLPEVDVEVVDSDTEMEVPVQGDSYSVAAPRAAPGAVSGAASDTTPNNTVMPDVGFSQLTPTASGTDLVLDRGGRGGRGGGRGGHGGHGGFGSGDHGGRGGGRGGRGGIPGVLGALNDGGQGGLTRDPTQIGPNAIGTQTTTTSGRSADNTVATPRPAVNTPRPVVGNPLQVTFRTAHHASAVAATYEWFIRTFGENTPMHATFAPPSGIQPWQMPGWTDPPPRNLFLRARLEGRGGGASVASTQGEVGSTLGDEASTLGDEAVGEASGHGGGDVNRGGSGAGGRGGRGGRRGGRGGRGGAAGGVVSGRVELNRGQNLHGFDMRRPLQAQLAEEIAMRRSRPNGWLPQAPAALPQAPAVLPSGAGAVADDAMDYEQAPQPQYQ